MSYISIDSNDIQAGVDSKNILEDVQEVIYELSVYDYRTAKLKLREGVSLEDFVHGIAIGLLGEYRQWDYVQRNKQKEEAWVYQ